MTTFEHPGAEWHVLVCEDCHSDPFGDFDDD